MKHFKPVKLHSVIGDATTWTDELWSKVFPYVQQNTAKADVLFMVQAVGIESAPSASKSEYLRVFRDHPPTVLLSAFDLMRKHKRPEHQLQVQEMPEHIAVQNPIRIDDAARPPAAPREHTEVINSWCAHRRVAPSAGMYPVEARVRGNAVTIIEHYPDRRGTVAGASEPIRVAQLRYRDGNWRLYCPTSELAWNLYRSVPAAPTPDLALDELARDSDRHLLG